MFLCTGKPLVLIITLKSVFNSILFERYRLVLLSGIFIMVVCYVMLCPPMLVLSV